MRSSPGRQLINQFLVELDGVATDNEGILILAATNAPWHVDDAFAGPGASTASSSSRLPTAGPARRSCESISRAGCRRRSIWIGSRRRTEGYSGADLRALVDVAVESKLAASMRDGVPRPLTTDDLLAATRKSKATTAEWFQTVRNYALHANQAGSYDAILEYLRRT